MDKKKIKIEHKEKEKKKIDFQDIKGIFLKNQKKLPKKKVFSFIIFKKKV
jgi:hypothetical protein